jgi:hypothetical protein
MIEPPSSESNLRVFLGEPWGLFSDCLCPVARPSTASLDYALYLFKRRMDEGVEHMLHISARLNILLV